MKPRTVFAAAAVVLAAFCMSLACGGSADSGAGGAKASAQKKAPGKTTPVLPAIPEEIPVTVEFVGFSADKEHARYRIHVETEKPVTQVDVGIAYKGADGKEQRETVVWQSAAGPKAPPTERGKAYEGEAPVEKGATGVVCRVLHVVYKDMTSWAPSK